MISKRLLKERIQTRESNTVNEKTPTLIVFRLTKKTHIANNSKNVNNDVESGDVLNINAKGNKNNKKPKIWFVFEKQIIKILEKNAIYAKYLKYKLPTSITEIAKQNSNISLYFSSAFSYVFSLQMLVIFFSSKT